MVKALAWYFDFSVNPVRYGVTLWSSTCEYLHTGVYPPSPTNIQITLESAESGMIDNPLSIDFVISKSLDKLSLSNESDNCIVLEKFPHQKSLENKLKNLVGTDKSIKPIEREDIIADQIIHYASLINVDRYCVAEFFLYNPDLIFDDFSDRNLIDPILSDEQTDFLQTESFLIGCHYWDQHFKPGNFFYSSICLWSR